MQPGGGDKESINLSNSAGTFGRPVSSYEWHFLKSSTVVGVLVEVPVMLSLVWIANKTKIYF